jgi:hypothetical protein
MTTITAALAAIPLTRPRAPARPSRPAAWATLARRRISLSAHTPREILAPLATRLLFALVIAPALAKIIQATGGGGADYSTFVIAAPPTSPSACWSWPAGRSSPPQRPSASSLARR